MSRIAMGVVATILCLLILRAVAVREDPPTGWVVVGQDTVRMMWVGSCWDGICADGMAFFDPWDSLGVPELRADRGAVATLTYSRAPDRIVVRSMWDQSHREYTGPVALPREPGVHDYMVTAVWEEGDVVEGFRVRIGEEQLGSGEDGRRP